MRQYEVLSSMIADYMQQANQALDRATDPGGSLYDRAMGHMVASRCLSVVATLAIETKVLVEARKLEQEAIDPIAGGKP